MSSDTTHIKRNRPVSATIETSTTRPADTTTYAAGDVVSNSTSAATILTFAAAARGAGLGGVIQNAVLIDSLAQSTKPHLDLFLFDTAPAMQQDNAAFSPSDAELEKCLGVITFDGTNGTSFKTTANGGLIGSGAISLSFKCAASATAIYGVLVARNAYAPGSAEKFTVRLSIIQD